MNVTVRNPLFEADWTAARLSDLTSQLTRAQDAAMTGLSVRAPSDAPAKWSPIHANQSALADQATWQTGMTRATDVLEVADTTLDAAAKLVTQAYERAVQLSSGQYGADERTAGAEEIAGVFDDLVGLANTVVEGRYLFAGDDYHGAAFDSSGVYQGSTASTAVRISESTTIATSFDGSQVFAGSLGDVFQTLKDLKAALSANDPTAVNATIDRIDSARRQIVDARQEVGYSLARVDDARLVSENLANVASGQLDGLVGADPATAYTRLASLQTTYQAAIQVTASSSSGSRLFDLLR